MNSYKNIPMWENARRRHVLEEFHDDVVSYFNNLVHNEDSWMVEGQIENTDAVLARQRINHTVDQAQRIIRAAGIAQIIKWTPPPQVGGYVQQIDVLPNLFELTSFQIPHTRAVDLIERALGVYQSDRPAAFRRTINPLWWLFRWLLWFARIPFVFLGAVGFDAARAEGSVVGKFFKAIFASLAATAALLTVLSFLGQLPWAKALLGIE